MDERKFKSSSGYRLQKLSNYATTPIDLEKDQRITGLIGWALLVGYVIAYDIYAIRTQKVETLTRSFWRLSDKKISRAPVFFAWAVVTSHLVLEKNLRRKISKQS
jgi:hypothetical protein